MLTAIRFDDQLSFATDKIRDISGDCLLTNKFESVQTAVAQSEPKLSLGIGLLMAQTPFQSDCGTVWSAHRTCPSPGFALWCSPPSPRRPGRGKIISSRPRDQFKRRGPGQA